MADDFVSFGSLKFVINCKVHSGALLAYPAFAVPVTFLFK